MKNKAKETDFQNLFGKLSEKQQDSVLGMEREFTLAAQLYPDKAPLPPDDPSRRKVRTVSER
jgi:hypothetical protein